MVLAGCLQSVFRAVGSDVPCSFQFPHSVQCARDVGLRTFPTHGSCRTCPAHLTSPPCLTRCPGSPPMQVPERQLLCVWTQDSHRAGKSVILPYAAVSDIDIEVRLGGRAGQCAWAQAVQCAWVAGSADCLGSGQCSVPGWRAVDGRVQVHDSTTKRCPPHPSPSCAALWPAWYPAPTAAVAHPACTPTPPLLPPPLLNLQAPVIPSAERETFLFFRGGCGSTDPAVRPYFAAGKMLRWALVRALNSAPQPDIHVRPSWGTGVAEDCLECVPINCRLWGRSGAWMRLMRPGGAWYDWYDAPHDGSSCPPPCSAPSSQSPGRLHMRHLHGPHAACGAGAAHVAQRVLPHCRLQHPVQPAAQRGHPDG